LNAFDGNINLEKEIFNFYSSTSEVSTIPKYGKNRDIVVKPISHIFIELASVPLSK
jgi:hypothetical protein